MERICEGVREHRIPKNAVSFAPIPFADSIKSCVSLFVASIIHNSIAFYLIQRPPHTVYSQIKSDLDSMLDKNIKRRAKLIQEPLQDKTVVQIVVLSSHAFWIGLLLRDSRIQ